MTAVSRLIIAYLSKDKQMNIVKNHTSLAIYLPVVLIVDELKSLIIKKQKSLTNSCKALIFLLPS